MNAPAVITAGGLTLIRTASGGHRIELRDDARMLVACLASIEPDNAAPDGDALKNLANWPASPQVQEWHDERRGNATVLMAVGRAGCSHWSISCEVTAEGRVSFDVAARINEPPQRLGSSYRLSMLGARTESPEPLELGGGWELRIDDASTQWRLDETSHVLSIEPIAQIIAQFPQTLRWRYWLQKRPVEI